MSMRHAFGLIVVGAAVAACSSASNEEEVGLGQATAAITNVPSDVKCIVVTATGNRVAERKFDVTAGASSVVSMTGLPVGSVVFTGNAYPLACSALTSSTAPTWLSDGVNATLAAGVNVPVTLPLRRNGSSTVSVDFDDGPTDAGAPSSLTIAPTTVAFASTLLGSTSPSTVTVTNTGSAIGAPTVTLSGADAAQFAIVSNGCTSGLVTGGSCTIGVNFAPTTRGAKAATLTINGSTVPLSGTGLAPAQLTISPASRNFGSQSITGVSAPFAFTVTNLGDVATGTTSLPLLGGPDASQFEVAGNTCPAIIGAGASCTMSVRFAPKSTGTFNATVSQNPVGVPGVTATLQGTGSLF